MFLNPQQQQPGMFPSIDAMADHIPPWVKYVLAACCGVGGYIYGVNQDTVPVALCMAIGLVVGLLLTALLLKALSFLAVTALVILAAGLTFFLLSNDQAIKHHRPVRQAAPFIEAPQRFPGRFD